MFDDLPPDLDRLRTLRTWHQMWLHRIDRKIALLTQRQNEPDRDRRRPPTSEWTAEPGTGPGRSPAYVHHGSCVLSDPRRRPIGRDEARRLLATAYPPADAAAPTTDSPSSTQGRDQPACEALCFLGAAGSAGSTA